MTIYIRFESNKQVETTILENKPKGNDWYEAPKNFDWEKSYCLTEGGKIAERTQEDMQKELLDNEKLLALDSIRAYYNNFTYQYAGYSHQKAKSYQIQAKAAKNILAAQRSELAFAEKDTKIVEPLAKVREISIVEMAKIIQSKAQQGVEAIAKCEALEDLAKKKIKEVKSEEELQSLLEHFKQKMQKVFTD